MRGFRRALCVMMALLVVSGSGCMIISGESPSPSPSGEFRSGRDKRPDVVSIAPPPGWKLIKLSDVELIGDWRVVSAAEPDHPQIGISFSFFGTDYTDSAHLLEARNDRMRELSVTSDISRLRPLSSRLIGGALAEGFEYFFEQNGQVYQAQSWDFVREDGAWSVSVVGFSGGGSIPQELLDSLGTVKWTRRK